MHWSFTLALTAAVLVTAAPLLEEREAEVVPTCAPGVAENWVNQKPSWAAQDPKGQQFCMTKWQGGSRIHEIKGWYEDDSGKCTERPNDYRGALQRIEVTFANGEKTAIGKKNPLCFAGVIGLTDNDIVDKVVSYAAIDNPTGQGMLSFDWHESNNPGNTHSAKVNYSPLTQSAKAWEPVTGSGILIGLIGHIDGEVITSITPIFTPSPIRNIERKNIRYVPGDLSRANVRTTEIADATFYNDLDIDSSFKFTAQSTRTSTYTHSGSQKVLFNVAVEYARVMKIPAVVETSIKGTFTIGGEFEQVQTNTETSTRTYNIEQSGNLAVGKAIHCIAVTGEADGEFDMDADIIIHYTDGTTWSYTERSTLSSFGLTALRYSVTCSVLRGDVPTANIIKLSSMHL